MTPSYLKAVSQIPHNSFTEQRQQERDHERYVMRLRFERLQRDAKVAS